MANELVLTSRTGGALALTDSFGDVIKPFVRDILIKESQLDGTVSVDDALALAKDVKRGDWLTMRRVMDASDAFKVAVLNAAGETIGYVHRLEKEIVARLMDAGKKMKACVVSKSVDGHWLDVRLGIYLEDV